MTGNRTWRDAVVLVCGRGLEAVGQVVAIRALTTFLSPYEAGRYYLLLGVTSWISLGVVNPVSTYCGRRLIEWADEGSASRHILRFVKFVLIVSLLGAGLIVVIGETVGLGVAVTTSWLAWIALGLLLFGSNASGFVAALNVLGQRALYVALKNLTLWGGLGLSVLGAVALSARSELWISGQVMISAVVATIAGVALFEALRAWPRSKNAAQTGGQAAASRTTVLRFAWPLSVAVCLYWIQTQGYRFVLVGISGEEPVGLFVVGYSVGAALLAAFEALATEFYQPIFYRAISAQDRAGRVTAWNEYAAWYLPSIVLMGAYVATCGPFLLRLVAGERFQGLGGVVILAALTESVRLVSSAFYMAAVAELNMRRIVVPGALGAALALAGVAVLGSINELQGTGLALFLAALGVMLAMGFEIRRWLAIDIPWAHLGKAAAIAVPVMVFLVLAAHRFPKPTLADALVILVAGGGYVLVGQIFLGRRVLFGRW